MRVYLVQMGSVPGEKEKNLEKARQMVLDAKPACESLILFPEMFATGYIPERAEELAEDFETGNSPTAQMLSQLAKETNCFILGGGIHRADNCFTNRVCLYDPTNATGKQPYYDKVHPFFPEQKDFAPGKEITLFKTQDLTLATAICYDLRFPEEFRKAKANGAQAFTVQASWPLPTAPTSAIRRLSHPMEKLSRRQKQRKNKLFLQIFRHLLWKKFVKNFPSISTYIFRK